MRVEAEGGLRKGGLPGPSVAAQKQGAAGTV
jgi:hypothetical protein